MKPVSAAIPLTFASPGEPVRIVGFGHGRDMEKRLAAMGLALGGELRLMQREGGNLVVAVGNTRLALGRGLAQKIQVTPA